MARRKRREVHWRISTNCVVSIEAQRSNWFDSDANKDPGSSVGGLICGWDSSSKVQLWIIRLILLIINSAQQVKWDGYREWFKDSPIRRWKTCGGQEERFDYRLNLSIIISRTCWRMIQLISFFLLFSLSSGIFRGDEVLEEVNLDSFGCTPHSDHRNRELLDRIPSRVIQNMASKITGIYKITPRHYRSS